MADMITDTTVGIYRHQLLQQQQQHRQRPQVGRDIEPRRSGYDVPPLSLQRNELLFSPRRRREFTPNDRKDQTYWDRRHRNNEAARRSREKRRLYDIGLERKVVELSKENYVLKVQLIAIKHKFGVSGDDAINAQQVMALLPTNEQMLLSIAKRPRTSLSTPSAALYYSQNDVGDSVSRSSSNGHSDSSSPTEQQQRQRQEQQKRQQQQEQELQKQQQQQRQQQRKRQRNDVCGVDTNAAYPFASVPAPPSTCSTYTDGVLNLARGPPQRDEPSSSGDGDDDTNVAGTSPPVIWRAFAAAEPEPGVATTAACCQLYGGGEDKRQPVQENASGAWCRRRAGDDDYERDPDDVGLSWGAVRPGVGPPQSRSSSWLMMAGAAATAAACARCALDVTASGPNAG